MPSGGKRPGAGRKATRPQAARRLMLELSAAEARQLAALERRCGVPASVIMRLALSTLHSDVQAGRVEISSETGARTMPRIDGDIREKQREDWREWQRQREPAAAAARLRDGTSPDRGEQRTGPVKLNSAP